MVSVLERSKECVQLKELIKLRLGYRSKKNYTVTSENKWTDEGQANEDNINVNRPSHTTLKQSEKPQTDNTAQELKQI